MAAGRKTGGRQKGVPNKATAAKAAEIAASGKTPLEFMLAAMRDDDKTFEQQFEAAKAAAPYVHPRLSAVEAKVDAEVQATIRKIERHVVDPQNPDA